jgi:hypothetical protein
MNLSVLTHSLTPWSRVLLEKLTVNFAASQEIPHILSLLLTKYFSGDKVNNNDVGGACSTYGERGEVHAGFW